MKLPPWGTAPTPPGSAWQTLFSAPTVGPGRGTRCDYKSPEQEGSTDLSLQPPSAAAPASLAHPPSSPSKHCLPGVLKDYLAPTPAGCSLRLQLPPASRPVLPYPACPPTPLKLGAKRSSPPLTGCCPGTWGWTLGVRLPGACRLHCRVCGGRLAARDLACPFLPPTVAPTWAQRVKGVINCLLPVIHSVLLFSSQRGDEYLISLLAVGSGGERDWCEVAASFSASAA